MGLHFILQHLYRPGTYVRILFVDFGSAFNTIIPYTLQNKLTQLSIPTSICQWITIFLTDRQQPVRSALKLPRAVFSPHCSSPSTQMTAHLKTPLSSSWSLQTTPHWSASSRTVTSLLTDRRLRSWLSGAVSTTWSWTCSKQWRWSWTSGETPLLSSHLHHEQHCRVNFVNEHFFLWLRRDVDKLKLISDDKIYDEMYTAPSLTRQEGTRMLFEDNRTFKMHPIG